MNLALFTIHVNQVIQANNEPLKGLCEQLRVHTGSSVLLQSTDGQAIVDLSTDAVAGESSAPQAPQRISMPITSHETSLGTLALWRSDRAFSDNEQLAVNIALSIFTLLLRQLQSENAANKKRRTESVRAVINTLSYSELEAAVTIIKVIDGNEGKLIAGQIAKQLGFTGAVITSAMRKLQGAGLIETRCLGMKGTYICVKDALLANELGKLS